MKKVLKWTVSILLSVFLIFTLLGFMEYRSVLAEMPLENKVTQVQSKSNYVKIDDISDYLLKATIATEDQRFYSHHGVDFIAYGRILYVLITSGKINSGGSTISQQLAKNLYFGYEPSIIRKFAEFFMVHDIETRYEKDEILELYINYINYGDNHMGIYQASQGYFHKEPKDLSFNEATLLAGIPQSPANYQLSNHADMAYKRQQVVIRALIDNHIYTQEEIEELLNGD